MKAISTLVLLFTFIQLSFAQNDTLIWNDFQTMDLDPSTSDDVFSVADESTTDIWINWDEDGTADNQNEISQFYSGLEFMQQIDTMVVDTNVVASAVSWLLNLETYSSNWLITPAIDVVDDQATLHWKSAMLQGPRYMDGYKVKILVGSNNYLDADSVHTVFEAAEMRDILAEVGDTVAKDSFSFTTGYIHADCFTLEEYFAWFDDTSEGMLYRGGLEPHSLSLAEFAGQTIHVAFHHDSSDDNVISFDDILLLGSLPSNTINQNVEDFRFISYPNPATNFVNIMYRLKESSPVQLSIFDMNGKRVKTVVSPSMLQGEQNHKVPVFDLPQGNYFIHLMIGNKKITKSFVKH